MRASVVWLLVLLSSLVVNLDSPPAWAATSQDTNQGQESQEQESQEQNAEKQEAEKQEGEQLGEQKSGESTDEKSSQNVAESESTEIKPGPSVGETPEAKSPAAMSPAAEAEMVGFQQFLLGKESPSLDYLRTLQQRVNGLVEQLRPAVVGIRMGGGQGSGVIVTGDGYVLTAAHVVGRKGQKAEIVMPDGSTHVAIVLGTDAASDSGMLRLLDKGPWPYAEIGESSSLERGQWLMSLGHPGGFDPDRSSVVRVGRLLMEPGRTTLQTDCTLVGGDSGGPLFDLEGRVVGIHSRISRRIQQNFHVSVDIFTSQWDEMSKEPAPSLGFSADSELVVSRVGESGPADRAGLKSGDKVLRINEKAVATKDELRATIEGLKLNAKVKIVVLRDGVEVELEFVVGTR